MDDVADVPEAKGLEEHIHGDLDCSLGFVGVGEPIEIEHQELSGIDRVGGASTGLADERSVQGPFDEAVTERCVLLEELLELLEITALDLVGGELEGERVGRFGDSIFALGVGLGQRFSCFEKNDFHVALTEET